MTATEDPPAAKIYPNRVGPFIFTAVCAIMLYYVATGYIWSGPFSMTAQAWEAQNPIRVIMGVLGALFFAGGALICLYYTIAPRPLFAFDSVGMAYQLPLFRRGYIPWSDVATISAYRQSPIRPGSGWVFRIRVRLKPAAISTRSDKQEISLSTSEYLLPTTAAEVVRQLRHFHKVDFWDGQLARRKKR